MLEIILYAISIMYTPGPVNLIGLNVGLNKKLRLLFCAGVGIAMFVMFLIFGYTGAWLVRPEYQLIISLLGCLYILYLAWKVSQSFVDVDSESNKNMKLNFSNGFLVQLLNPKAPVAILPLTTVQFPSAGITGFGVLVWSALLGSLAFGAPATYMLSGKYLSRWVRQPNVIKAVNLLLAGLLIYVAIDILYRQLF